MADFHWQQQEQEEREWEPWAAGGNTPNHGLTGIREGNDMNKRQAKEEAWNNQRTVGELRELIKASRGKGGVSKVNKGLSHDKALDILWNSIATRDESEVLKGHKIDIYDRAKMTGDGLIVQNILRESA